MKWSLNELRQTADEPLMFEETLDLKASLTKRRPEILDVSRFWSRVSFPLMN